MAFYTEADLRKQFGMGEGSELRLHPEDKLTPAASELARQRKIRIVYVGEDGAVSVEDKKTGEKKKVHPLRIDLNEKPETCCMLCGQKVAKKPEGLTHVNATTLVPKNHPRIIFRGKLDTTIAAAVLVQTQFDKENRLPSQIKGWISDLRSWLGRIMRAEVTGEELPPLSMGDLDLDKIHAISHNPKKYLGHEHIVAGSDHGENVARLNWVRAQVRELEVVAVNTFTKPDLTLDREDIVEALNRLSSAVYVLMLATLAAQKGNDLSAIGAS